MKKQETTQVNQTQPLAVPAKELANMLNVSLRQIWRLNEIGMLPRPMRLGGSIRWSRKEIEAFIEAGAPDREIWEAMKADRRNSYDSSK